MAAGSQSAFSVQSALEGGAAVLALLAIVSPHLPPLLAPRSAAAILVGDETSRSTPVSSGKWSMPHWLYPEFNGEYLPPKPPPLLGRRRSRRGSTGRSTNGALARASAFAGAATVALTSAEPPRLLRHRAPVYSPA